MARVKVCPRVGCPSLMPCETHSRPANASWSKDRNRQAQHKFRQAVLGRDGHRCTRCQATGATTALVAHHIQPGYDMAAGITLCESCHREVDAHAR